MNKKEDGEDDREEVGQYTSCMFSHKNRKNCNWLKFGPVFFRVKCISSPFQVLLLSLDLILIICRISFEISPNLLTKQTLTSVWSWPNFHVKDHHLFQTWLRNRTALFSGWASSGGTKGEEPDKEHTEDSHPKRPGLWWMWCLWPHQQICCYLRFLDTSFGCLQHHIVAADL